MDTILVVLLVFLNITLKLPYCMRTIFKSPMHTYIKLHVTNVAVYVNKQLSEPYLSYSVKQYPCYFQQRRRLTVRDAMLNKSMIAHSQSLIFNYLIVWNSKFI